MFPHDLSSASQLSSTTATSVIKGLIRERDALHAQSIEDTSTIEQLQRRLYAKATDNDATNLPYEIVTRLHRRENEVQRLRKTNDSLKDNLTAAENETCLPREQLVDRQEKMKGANKKTKNAKEVASKEEKKAKTAVGDEQRHVESVKKIRREQK